MVWQNDTACQLTIKIAQQTILNTDLHRRNLSGRDEKLGRSWSAVSTSTAKPIKNAVRACIA
eukprot:SAG31_NODE_41031_length_278_cov_0.575419_1_plen_61_part_10